MNDSAKVELERRDDGVAVVRLVNGKVNALSTRLLDELTGVAAALTDDPPGAVVITGSDRFFAAGADISEFAAGAQAIGLDRAEEIGNSFRVAFDSVAGIPRMVIAAVNGFALGGGCELALACDLRIAGERAKFGQPEVLLGIVPGGGATQRLSRLVGPARAKELMCTGRTIDAAEAARIGLVDEVVADDQVLVRAMELATSLATGATGAQGMIKHAVDHGLDISLGGGLDLEGQLFARVFTSADATIGVRSFIDNGPGKAKFTGR